VSIFVIVCGSRFTQLAAFDRPITLESHGIAVALIPKPICLLSVPQQVTAPTTRKYSSISNGTQVQYFLDGWKQSGSFEKFLAGTRQRLSVLLPF
jgi:hypothetical protein